MSMSTISLLVLLVITIFIIAAQAKPLVDRSNSMAYDTRIESALSARAAAAVAVGQMPISHRQARQGYYSPYDYYFGGQSYDSSPSSDYYQYSNYLSPDYYYQRPVHRPPRRRGDSRPFGPTTQKYTVWDLA